MAVTTVVQTSALGRYRINGSSNSSSSGAGGYHDELDQVQVSSELSTKLALGGIACGSTFRRGRRPNTALWVTASHRLYEEEVPYPTCGPLDCIVHVRCTGICGSEIHFWKTGRIGDCCVSHDLILGHESAGEILEVGKGVKNLRVGDRVSIEPGVACLSCKQCLTGRYNLCPTVRFSGTPPSHGTMARYVSHPARFLHKIPDTMTYAQGALVEPLSVAVGAVERANIKLGQPTLVCGAGPVSFQLAKEVWPQDCAFAWAPETNSELKIGLAAALSARAAGAHPICITDLDENRLQQARELGFDRTVQVQPTWGHDEISRAVLSTMGPDCRPEVAFECTGAQSSIAGAIYSVVDGGTVLQVGCGKPHVTLPLMAMSFREVNIVTSFRYKHTWPVVIRLLGAGVLGPAERLVTHTFPLDRILEAFETCVTPSARSIKVQISD